MGLQVATELDLDFTNFKQNTRTKIYQQTRNNGGKKIDNESEKHWGAYIGVCVDFDISCNVLLLKLSVDISQKQLTLLCS